MKHFFAICLMLISSSSLWALTHEDLVEKIRLNNQDVLKAQAEYRQAKLDTSDAKGGLGPKVDLQISGTFMVNPPIGEIKITTEDLIKQGDLNGVDLSALRGRDFSYQLYEGMENTLYSFELSITQPIFTWGKITKAIKLYEKVEEIRQLQVEILLAQKECELYGHEVALYYLNQIEKLLKEQISKAERLVSISKAYEENGMILSQEVISANLQAQQLDVAIKNVQLQKDSQLRAIQRLCYDSSIDVDLDFVPDEEKIASYEKSSRNDLEAAASGEQNNNLRMLRMLCDVAAIAREIAGASVNWKPDVAFQASLGFSGQRFPLFQPEWQDKGDWHVNLSLGIRTTVWDGGKAVRDVTRKKIGEENAEIDYNNAVVQIKENVAKNYFDLQLSSSKAEYQKLMISGSELEFKQKKAEYDSGYGNEIEVLKKELEILNNKISLAQLQMDTHVAAATLDYLTSNHLLR
ncbi:MAG TPA: hypothetical protein DCM57_05540 [Treponema sp.]|nr:hypothetical protein [Treponema sp.]